MSDSLQTGQWVDAVVTNGGTVSGYLLEGNKLLAVEGSLHTNPWWFVFPIYRDDSNDMLQALRDVLADGAWYQRDKSDAIWTGLRSGFSIFGVMTILKSENTRFVEALKHPVKKPTRRGRHRKMRIREVVYGALDGDD